MPRPSRGDNAETILPAVNNLVAGPVRLPLNLPEPAMTAARPSLLCFGEILWDFLPAGLFPGGAPFNVAYHLHRQGTGVLVVSAVGCDLLGDELRRRLEGWGLDTGGIARHPDLPTGHVRATVSARGDASYEIVANVAWDRITLTEEVLHRVHTAGGLIYGSLSPALSAQPRRPAPAARRPARPARGGSSMSISARLDDPDLVNRLATGATLLKLNSAEAARLVTGQPESAGREESDARTLAARTGCPTVCITAGARGAGLLRAGRWHWETGRPVTVADTVGSGDAFLAALVISLMEAKQSDAESLARACRRRRMGRHPARRHAGVSGGFQIVGRGLRTPPGSATALGRNRAPTIQAEKDNEKDWILARRGCRGGVRRPTLQFAQPQTVSELRPQDDLLNHGATAQPVNIEKRPRHILGGHHALLRHAAAAPGR